MRSWRNWQTRKTKDLVGNSMQVQFLSTAPQKRKSLSRFPFLLFRHRNCFSIPGRSSLAIPSLRSLRPHQNRVIMRNERINTLFFAYLTCLCSQKAVFLLFSPSFGVHFGVHFSISVSLYSKSPSRIFSRRAFLSFKD